MAMMPQALTAALEQITDAYDGAGLERDAKTISENYRMRTGKGERLLTKEREAAAYAASRMPATFAAARAALEEALAAAPCEAHTLLDCGAGTGAASWAAQELLNLDAITCLEREAAMRSVGSRLMAQGGGALPDARWENWDVTEDKPLPQADLVIEGYMLGELREEHRLAAARRLFAAAGKMLVLVEPGTPQGYANLAAVRADLVSLGAHVAAPCPSGSACCPMREGDWCHFSVRVQRTKLHKALKGGDAPYEDEKYAYLALTKEPPAAPCAARVLRHPLIAPGKITLTLCSGGEKNMRAVTKKDPLWKRARKISAGERLD